VFDWRRMDDVRRFAGAGPHRRAQRRFLWHYGSSDAVSVWHEVATSHHGVYGHMPPLGLGATGPVRSEPWYASTQ
jgi:hypothetical protein